MRVTVDYLFPTGLTQESGPLDAELPSGSTVGDLLAYLLETYGETVRQRLVKRSDGAPFVTFLVNGEQAGLEHILSAGDKLMIVPPIAGG